MKNSLIGDLFDKGKTYTTGILCTYSLDIEFVENYLLNLDGFTNCRNLCVFTDRNVYQKLFESGRSNNFKWINKRYYLIPIDSQGVFHPKMYILASDKLIKVGIGSANLTREGLSSNLEIGSVFEIRQEQKTYLGLLHSCYTFLYDLSIRSGSNTAKEFLNNLNDILQRFVTEDKKENVHLFHNLEINILSQVQDFLSGREVKSIKVFSPFFDKNLSVYKHLKKYFPQAAIYFYIQQGKTNFPTDEYKHLCNNDKVYIFKNQERYMHGKAVIFETENGNYLLTGSANFTEAAMLSAKGNGNIETSIFGAIDGETLNGIMKPGYKSFLLKNIDELEITSTVQDEQQPHDERIIVDWLIEAVLSENQLQIVLRDKEGIVPDSIFFNGNKDKNFKYSDKIDIKGLKKSEITYVQVSGLDMQADTVESGKVWITDKEISNESYTGKRYSINDPMQLSEILKEMIEKGTEDELIDYLYKFNIPVGLTGLFSRQSGLKATESFGNVFGSITAQQANVWNSTNLYEAVRYFLKNHYNKLVQHYENVQLQHLSNFILIFSSIFSMIKTMHELIILDKNNEDVITANEWSQMRYYYDTFLQYSQQCMELLCSQDKQDSFENRVNVAIMNDAQEMLGNIATFKEFLLKRDYDYHVLSCYKTIKSVCWHVDNYIHKGKVLTKLNEVKPMPIANNGYRDNYIKHRVSIYKYANELTKYIKASNFD